MQEAILREQPVVYNKEAPLNPFFVVFGRRRAVDGSTTIGGLSLPSLPSLTLPFTK